MAAVPSECNSSSSTAISGASLAAQALVTRRAIVLQAGPVSCSKIFERYSVQLVTKIVSASGGPIEVLSAARSFAYLVFSEIQENTVSHDFQWDGPGPRVLAVHLRPTGHARKDAQASKDQHHIGADIVAILLKQLTRESCLLICEWLARRHLIEFRG